MKSPVRDGQLILLLKDAGTMEIIVASRGISILGYSVTGGIASTCGSGWIYAATISAASCKNANIFAK